MQQDTSKMQLFYEYYKQWIEVYKKGAIRDATMAKYLMTQKWVEKLAPELKVCELTRTAYQKLLNDYTVTAYTCISSSVCRCINCQCGQTPGACQYDNNAENISAYHSGTRK